MVLCTTLSAENPNGNPGLLTFSLGADEQNFKVDFTLPLTNWLTAHTGFNNNLLADDYLFIFNGSFYHDNDVVTFGNLYEPLELLPYVQLDFHIQLWNR
tara:strand:+ start:182 stop:478 length:297 start_codon:yes stop_codon:yes gene_type:complete